MSMVISEVKNNDKTPLENYHRLFKLTNSFDKLIAETYDNMGGSRYFITVISLYMRGVLTDNDISALDDDLIHKLKTFLRIRD